MNSNCLLLVPLNGYWIIRRSSTIQHHWISRDRTATRAVLIVLKKLIRVSNEFTVCLLFSCISFLTYISVMPSIPWKMIFVVNMSLKMGQGKVAAQVNLCEFLFCKFIVFIGRSRCIGRVSSCNSNSRRT
jgi:hypothetical protein